MGLEKGLGGFAGMIAGAVLNNHEVAFGLMHQLGEKLGIGIGIKAALDAVIE